MSIYPNIAAKQVPSPDAQEVARRASYQARREEVFRQRREREKRQREAQAQLRQQQSYSSSCTTKGSEELFSEGNGAFQAWTATAGKSDYQDLLIQDHHTADDVIGILSSPPLNE